MLGSGTHLGSPDQQNDELLNCELGYNTHRHLGESRWTVLHVPTLHLFIPHPLTYLKIHNTMSESRLHKLLQPTSNLRSALPEPRENAACGCAEARIVRPRVLPASEAHSASGEEDEDQGHKGQPERCLSEKRFRAWHYCRSKRRGSYRDRGLCFRSSGCQLAASQRRRGRCRR